MKKKKQQVPSKFPINLSIQNCKIALVGEAPGQLEEELNEPFVGRAGKLLNRLLKDATIDRDECYITNVFKERPENNKIDKFFISRRQLVVENEDLHTYGTPFKTFYLDKQYNKYLTMLHRELTEINPAVIIALGAIPLWAFTGRSDISTARGISLLWNNIPLIATFHPAYLLHGNMGHKDKVVADLGMAKSVANGTK